MKRQFTAAADTGAPPPTKDSKISYATQGGVKHRRAVPPGYLHDLFHTRHLMKSVGLRRPASKPPSGKNASLPVAVTGGRLIPGPRLPQSLPVVPMHLVPSLFEQRKRYLQRKRRAQRDGTPYRNNPDRPTGLLSLPDDVMLRIVCKLHHDDIMPLFFVCKQLNKTLREAIRFHFNYATPSRDAPRNPSPAMQQVRRPERRRQVSNTAFADVMAHLRRGPRALAFVPPGSVQRSAGNTGPRTLSFTPAATPLDRNPTPKSRLMTPGPAASRFGTPAPLSFFGATPVPSQVAEGDEGPGLNN